MLSGPWDSPLRVHRIPKRGLCNLTEPLALFLADLFMDLVRYRCSNENEL